MWMNIGLAFGIIFLVSLVLTIWLITKQRHNLASTMVTVATVSFVGTLVCVYLAGK